MKQKQCLSLIGLTLSISSILSANPAIPERQSSGRYEKITEDWPFAIETPRVPVVVNSEGPFTKFYVGGIAKTNENGNEQVFVAISSKDRQVSFTLFEGEEGPDGICVVGVEWNDNVGKSRVTLKKGNETGTIGFDEMAIKTPVPATGNPARPAGDPIMHSRTLKPSRAIPEPTTIPPQLRQGTPGATPPALPRQETDRARSRVIR